MCVATEKIHIIYSAYGEDAPYRFNLPFVCSSERSQHAVFKTERIKKWA
jgi:hypothetical protein